MAYIDLCWPDLFEAGTIYIFVLVCVLRGNTQRLFGSKLCCSFLIFVLVCLFLLLQFVVWLSFMRKSLGVQMHMHYPRARSSAFWSISIDRFVLGRRFLFLLLELLAQIDRFLVLSLSFSSFHRLFLIFHPGRDRCYRPTTSISLCRSSFPSCRTRLDRRSLVLSPPLAGVAPAGHVPRGWWVSFLFFHPAATATLPCSSRGGRSVCLQPTCLARDETIGTVGFSDGSNPPRPRVRFSSRLVDQLVTPSVVFLFCPTTLVTHLLLLVLLYFHQLINLFLL